MERSSSVRVLKQKGNLGNELPGYLVETSKEAMEPSSQGPGVMLDRFLGLVIMLFYVFCLTYFSVNLLWVTVTHVMRGKWRNAYSLFAVVREGQVICDCLLVMVFWFTLTHCNSWWSLGSSRVQKDAAMNKGVNGMLHRFWKRPLVGQESPMMTSGFILRPSAFLLGAMLFLSHAVLEMFPVVPINQDQFTDGDTWPFEMQCWANEVMEDNSASIGFRKQYSYDAEDLQGCFNRGFPWSHNDLEKITGKSFSNDGIYDDMDAVHAANFTYSNGEKGKACVYLCVRWQDFGLDVVVENFGIIGAGAVFVVEITVMFSRMVGFHLVHVDSTPVDLSRVLRLTVTSRATRRSSIVCALVVVAMHWISLNGAIHLNTQGVGSPSFIVCSVVCLSALSCFLVRSFDPFRMRPVVYTTELWDKGVDTFKAIVDGKVRNKEVDLYQWLQYSAVQRFAFLAMRARRVSDENASCEGKTGERVVSLMPYTVQMRTDRCPAGLKLQQGELVSITKRIEVPAGTKGFLKAVSNGTAMVVWDLPAFEGHPTAKRDGVECPQDFILECGDEWLAIDEEFEKLVGEASATQSTSSIQVILEEPLVVV